MSFEQSYSDTPPTYDFKPANETAARGRVLYPAIFLLVAAVINVFGALVCALGGIAYQTLPPKRIEQALVQQNPKQWEEMQRNGYTLQSIITLGVRFFFSVAGLTGFVALFMLIGAVRMIQLRSYGMAISSSLLSMMPCISPASCLMLGVFAGAWSLVVLVDPDVREAFL